MKKKQLVAGEDAVECDRQPTAACSDCPWARDALRGWLGTLSAEEWVEIAHSEMTADCHALKGPDEPWSCAGMAIFQANVCKSPRDPNALRLPADREKVFSRDAEFLDHHTGHKK